MHHHETKTNGVDVGCAYYLYVRNAQCARYAKERMFIRRFYVCQTGIPTLGRLKTLFANYPAVPFTSIANGDGYHKLTDLIKCIFSNPQLAGRVCRAQTATTLIDEVFKSNEYSKLCTQLSCPWQSGFLYVGDRVTVHVRGTEDKCCIDSMEDGRVVCVSGARRWTVAITDVVARLRLGTYGTRADGRPIVHVGYGLFSDETSGNVSKRWNYIDSLMLQPYFLPRDCQEMRLVFSSRNNDWTPLFDHILENMEELMRGVVMHDAHLDCEVLVVGSCVAVVSDNPRHASLAGIVGAAGTHHCRLCEAPRGTLLLEGTVPRSFETLRAQRQQAQRSLADAVEVQRAHGVLDRPNPFYDRERCIVDPTTQLPIDTLHTIDLGTTKYTMKKVKESTFSIAEAVLDIQRNHAQLGSMRDHNVAIDQLLRYSGSFIGKDLRYVAQRLPLLLRPTTPRQLPPGIFELAVITSWLAKLMTVRTLDKRTIDSQLRMLEECIGLFLRHVLLSMPDKVNAVKTHLLLHAVDNMRKFGPLVLLSTERGERANGVVRASLIASNRHNASRDIARRHAVHDAIHDTFCGAYGAGPEVIALGNNSYFREKMGAMRNRPKTWTAGDGVCWRNERGIWCVGQVVARCQASEWEIAQLLPTGERDELLVGYRPSGVGTLVLSAEALHSVDLISRPNGSLHRNVMAHDDIVLEEDHRAICEFVRGIVAHIDLKQGERRKRKRKRAAVTAPSASQQERDEVEMDREERAQRRAAERQGREARHARRQSQSAVASGIERDD